MALRTLVKKILLKSSVGSAFVRHIQLKQQAFKPASGEPFQYLSSKKGVKKIYKETFEEIFLLLKSLPLEGDIFEFGVCYGFTSRLLAQYMKQFQIDASLHLFDSFEGLPEARELDLCSYEHHSGVWKKGSMRGPSGIEDYIQRKLSKVLGDRIFVTKGFFEETLECYLSRMKEAKARLIFLDCDLYSASKCVLELLFKYNVIQDGTLIICDDWMTSLGNPNLGQRKAVAEVLEKHPTWEFEKYMNFGIGSHLFIAHDLDGVVKFSPL
ncbi:MAG: class I SAM-dependent methyltransferase [Chlamydiales bacterium]|nr:class I SAM-dependent methyltransferase [Chlamydiales bacterium]